MSIHYTNDFDKLMPSFDPSQQHAILQAREYHISSWLAVTPLERSQFDLSTQEFRDGLALRYKKPLLCSPPYCDGCGSAFSLEHALDCRKGGLVDKRHNDVRDAFGDLASLVWNPVVREPVVSDSPEGVFSHLLLICVCVGCGSHRPRHCLILG